MTTSTFQLKEQDLVLKEIFMSDFEEFAIDENMEQFNLDYIDEIDPLFS